MMSTVVSCVVSSKSVVEGVAVEVVVVDGLSEISEFVEEGGSASTSSSSTRVSLVDVVVGNIVVVVVDVVVEGVVEVVVVIVDVVVEGVVVEVVVVVEEGGSTSIASSSTRVVVEGVLLL